MLSATIVPQAFLHMVADHPYNMALGHLVQKEGFEAYTAFYREKGQDPNSFLMLDTGLIEGDARPTSELIEKARYMHADEMAVNDVFMDREGTLAASWKALNEIKASGLEIRTMGIPQGNCLEDWLLCAEEMIEWGFDTIGVPKVLVKLEGMNGRIDALRNLGNMMKSEQQIHLLGCWETPLELSRISAGVRDGVLVPVRGVDSAIAYAYAREGIRITDDERPQGEINFGAQTCDLDVLEYNIRVYKHEASEKPKEANSFFLL